MNPSIDNKKVGSCGRPILNTITKIIDIESGKTLGRNERGEICVKGPQVSTWYGIGLVLVRFAAYSVTECNGTFNNFIL
jgi:acyl-coenzyme A synthetase/AMP-(fatty) acid ligase